MYLVYRAHVMPNVDEPTSLPADYAAQIRSLRERRGLTQTQLAEAIGVSFASINRWERGHARPSPLAWQRLAHMMKTDHAGSRITASDLATSAGSAVVSEFLADPERVRLVAEAERLSFGHLFNPAFATETSLIHPLPHQRIAVYEHMLPEPRLRFLLADDAGAGKTIMAGLYIREMLARRLIRRVLIVPPAGLVGNWERELKKFFALQLRIVRGGDARHENPFVGAEGNLVICSVDTLAGDKVFVRLQDKAVEPYDLVIFDEAHKLSADREPDLTVRKTDRYKLAEALAGVPTIDPRWALPWSTNHLLLLTATPHMGKPFPYFALWRLLEPEILSTFDAFNAYPEDARAKHFIRRTKEEMVRFDGKPLYPQRCSDTLGFDLSKGEIGEGALYSRTTDYMQAFYNRAGVLNRSAARLAMAVFQRRLASSTFALLRSFERRQEKLDLVIEQVRSGKLTQKQLEAARKRLEDEDLKDPFDSTTADEETAADGGEGHEKTEDEILRIILTTSLADLEAEQHTVRELIALARAVLAQGHESKFERLRDFILQPEYRNEKLIIFTEHRDTLQWLRHRLEAMGYTDKIAAIHGAMDYRERDAEVERFRRPHAAGGAQYLLATDAAGEGINLQFCWLMVNYDVPWNPARLEQRMGRIHRYGQQHDPVIIVNLVANDTREGRVIATLLKKMEEMRKELKSDKVFDVVGRLFSNVSITEFMAQALSEEGTADAQRQLEGILTKEQVDAIEARERRLYGDGGDVKGQLPRLQSMVEVETYQRLLPGYVRQFVERAAGCLGLAIDGDLDGVFCFRPMPGKAGRLDPLLVVLETYPVHLRRRLTVYRPTDKEPAIFLHPGEPVFERLRAIVLDRFRDDAVKGAVFVDPTADKPYFLFVGETSMVRRRGPAPGDGDETLECRLVGLARAEDGEFHVCPVERLLLLRGSDRFPAAFARFAGKAPEITILAEGFLRTGVAEPMVAERRHDLLRALPEREDFVARGYDYQGAELAGTRAKLTEKARAGNAAARHTLERIKDQQRSLEERKAAAIGALHAEPDQLAVGDVSIIARALVIPSDDPGERERYDADVEAIAMHFARAAEEAAGATVKDVSTPAKARAAGLSDYPGFDLWAIYPSGEKRAIEVKGRAEVGNVEISENEWAKACNLREKYWLHVVFDCASPHPRMCTVNDPFAKLLAKAKGSVLVGAADIMASGDWTTSTPPEAAPLPAALRPLFWEYAFESLRWPTDRDLVIGRVLASGNDEAMLWLRGLLPEPELRGWLLSRQGAGMDPRRLRYWQQVLALPADVVDRWVERVKSEAWGRSGHA